MPTSTLLLRWGVNSGKSLNLKLIFPSSSGLSCIIQILKYQILYKHNIYQFVYFISKFIIYMIFNINKIFRIYISTLTMDMSNLTIHKNVPLKQTLSYLASFPRFSLIQKIQPKFFETSLQASIKVAQYIRDAIKAKAQKTNEPFVLGLATGSTPLKVYKQLVEMYKRKQISFKNVVTFNLDQYYPIAKNNLESYNYYMRINLFDHVDIPSQNINIPDGEIPKDKVSQFCEQYEKKIKSYGGIDLQILGIGRTGHIGFNEPPSPIKSSTRLVCLHRLTRKDAANAFNGMENVPKCAITMGIETISKAKKIIILAWSEAKADIVKKSIQGQQSNFVPSTFLHYHPDATFYLDRGAAQKLSRFKIPWTIKGDKQDPTVPLTKFWLCKMVQWLCKKVQKPILRLKYQDYEDNGLSNILMDVSEGNAQDLNLFIYQYLNNKITGWPLSEKPQYQKDARGEEIGLLHKKVKNPQRVLVFSPHPDDDVISMGGTINRLKDQGHQVYVAYMTTGSNAVHDYELKKYTYFMQDFLKYKQKQYEMKNNEKCKAGLQQLVDVMNDVKNTLEQRKQSELLNDSQLLRSLKGFIRNSQAKIAVQVFDIPPEDTFCMELPFYASHLKKKDISEADKIVLRKLIEQLKPTVIFAAGDLADPHGTHRKCLQIILQVQEDEVQKARLNENYQSIFPPPQKIFFYRGAWEEWELAMCRMIVPLSPVEVDEKVRSILKHQSQKDSPMFPGDDPRQFWARSKDRNRDTAHELNQLGFSNYEAAECFVNLWDLRNYEQF